MDSGSSRVGAILKGEVNRERHFFTEPHWVNRSEINLSGWSINRHGQKLARLNSGATNMAKKFLARMEKEGKLK